MDVIVMPESLRQKLGDQAAAELAGLLGALGKSARDGAMELLTERFERRLAGEVGTAKSDLKTEIAYVKDELKDEIARVRSELKDEIARVESGLSKDISHLEARLANTRADLIRWMFIFWIGQVAALAGLLHAFVR